MKEIEGDNGKSQEQILVKVGEKITGIYQKIFPKGNVDAFAVVSLGNNFYTADVTCQDVDNTIGVKITEIRELPREADGDPLMFKFSNIPAITDYRGGKLLDKSSIVVGKDDEIDCNFQTRIFRNSYRAGNFKHYTYPRKI